VSYEIAREPDWTARKLIPQPQVLSAKLLPGSLSNALAPVVSPTVHCADGKRLHAQYQISVLIDGKPKAFNISGGLVEMVRKRSRCAAVLIAAPLPSAKST